MGVTAVFQSECPMTFLGGLLRAGWGWLVMLMVTRRSVRRRGQPSTRATVVSQAPAQPFATLRQEE